MTDENKKFVEEWNKKSSTLSEVMKRCNIEDIRTAKTKARTLKKYLTCTREDKLSARGVAIENGSGNAEAPKEVKVASTKKLTAEETQQEVAKATGKKCILQFKNKRGDVVTTKEVIFNAPAQLSEMIKEFAAEQSFDKTVIEKSDGSSIAPTAVQDGDTIVIRPNVSGAR